MYTPESMETLARDLLLKITGEYVTAPVSDTDDVARIPNRVFVYNAKINSMADISTLASPFYINGEGKERLGGIISAYLESGLADFIVTAGECYVLSDEKPAPEDLKRYREHGIHDDPKRSDAVMVQLISREKVIAYTQKMDDGQPTGDVGVLEMSNDGRSSNRFAPHLGKDDENHAGS